MIKKYRPPRNEPVHKPRDSALPLLSYAAPKSPKKAGKNVVYLQPSRTKRGYDFKLNTRFSRLGEFFDYYVKEHGLERLIEIVYKRCGASRIQHSEEKVRKVASVVLTGLASTRRINLTSDIRYDVMYNLIEVLRAEYPKAEAVFYERIRRIDEIRKRFYDNHSTRRGRHCRRQSTDSG